MPESRPVALSSERHGSRWYHAEPSEQQVREWFVTQPLHEGMTHEPYMGGIVLISAKENIRITLEGQQGPYLKEVERVVFVPYVKVDTRITYFRNYVRVLNGAINTRREDGSLTRTYEPTEVGEFYGVIRPVEQTAITDPASAYYNANLPKGFSVYVVRTGENAVSRYLVATFEVAIFKRGGAAADSLILRGQGSKQTPMKRQYADDNAIMKAETGAIGRALGVAGMLVVGTGVATAEDMQEALGTPSGASTSATGAALPPSAPMSDVTTEEMIAEVALPAPEAADVVFAEELGSNLPNDDAALRTMAVTLRKELESKYPMAWQSYTAWWAERGFPTLEELSGPSLRGAVIKLQRDLDARQQAKSDLAP